MKAKTAYSGAFLSIAVLLASANGSTALAQVNADSITGFSGEQGQDGWYNGYRNVTVDGKDLSYDANQDFIPFDTASWTGSAWDLNTEAAAPWTLVGQQSVHPNGVNNGEEHWAIRRWSASSLTAPTWLQITWHAHKENVGGGNGVTGALYVNGERKQKSAIAYNDAVGVTNTFFLKAKSTDKIDLILSPVGANGVSDDGSDGSVTWMKIEQAVDTDNDGLPDVWEQRYSPGDLAKLSASGDFDKDGLTDAVELEKGTDPTKADTDGDGLSDKVETNTGTYVSATDTGTDPLKADTDGDGRKDGDEISGSVKSDPFNADSDGDLYSDGDEVAAGFDPNDPANNPEASAIANSVTQFSGVQGQDDWYFGYRNYTKDGGGENYNPDTGFIVFNADTQWTGAKWDLDTTARNPWTELGAENTHPNSSTAVNPDGYDTGVHWTIRRWVANQITKVTPLAFRWHARKGDTAGGNGVTGALYINGQRKDAAIIAGTDGVGVTHTYFANVAPGDKIDVILSPRGADGVDSDGNDGSNTRLLVNTTIPSSPIQPDGSIFIPAGAGDSDGDSLPDVWEKLFFPTDLTKLSKTGDYDKDGLSDLGEYQRGSDPTIADTDGDGLGDLVETGTGTFVSKTDTGSKPTDKDTDKDGLTDAEEVNATPASNPNKADTDGDGFSDAEEKTAGTNPTDPADNPLTYVIANSQKEFSGTQGKDGWYNGYRVYDPASTTMDYSANQDFIPYAGGEGKGDWDGSSQLWTGSSWDMNTAGAAPWTWQDAIGVHPNGTNSAPIIDGQPDVTQELWAVRRWAAKELTKDTPVTIVWQVRKANTSNDGTTGLLFINGKLVDSKALAGTDNKGEVRRYKVTLKSTDVVDLALSPAGLNGAREDWSDASETWFWVDARPQSAAVASKLLSAVFDAAQGKVAIKWTSTAGAKYSVETSPDLKSWSKLTTGLSSEGEQTTFTETLASPRAAMRFYRIVSE